MEATRKPVLSRLMACLLLALVPFVAGSMDAQFPPTQITSEQGSWSKQTPMPILSSETVLAAANAATRKPILSLSPYDL